MKADIKTSRKLSCGRTSVPAGSVEYHHPDPPSDAHDNQRGCSQALLTVRRLRLFNIRLDSWDKERQRNLQHLSRWRRRGRRNPQPQWIQSPG